MKQQILFFDGVCNLCNAFVDFLIQRDKEAKFTFAPLQGETAARLLPAHIPAQLKSVVLYQDGKTWEKSDAALVVLTELGGIWGLAKIFWLLPRVFRDAIYEFVAANRYKLFGKRETCRLPTPAEKSRFLS